MRKIILIVLVSLFLGSVVSAWELKIGDRKINYFTYLQTRYSMGPATQDQFTVPRLRTDIWGDLSERVGYFVEYDLAASPALVYGWINIKTSLTKISLGRLFLPFGLEYTTPPSRFDTINPTTTLWSFFAFSRDIGLQLSRKFEKVKYAVAVVNGADNSLSDDNQNKDLVGRVVFTPVDDMSFGFSRYTGKTGSTEVEKSVSGLEINLKLAGVGLKGEYIAGSVSGADKRGWYLQPLFNLTPLLQGLVRYESWDPNTAVAGDAQSITTLGLNYFFDEGSKLQVNYEIKGEESSPTDNDTLLLQFQVNF